MQVAIDLAGFKGPTSKKRKGRGEERKGRGRRQGTGRKGEKGRESKGRGGREGNIAFHHLLLDNLTTATN